jgi:hypothetical protein
MIRDAGLNIGPGRANPACASDPGRLHYSLSASTALLANFSSCSNGRECREPALSASPFPSRRDSLVAHTDRSSRLLPGVGGRRLSENVEFMRTTKIVGTISRCRRVSQATAIYRFLCCQSYLVNLRTAYSAAGGTGVPG